MTGTKLIHFYNITCANTEIFFYHFCCRIQFKYYFRVRTRNFFHFNQESVAQHNMKLGNFSLGIGDRFSHQGVA